MKEYKLIKKYPSSPEVGMAIIADLNGLVILNGTSFYPETYPEHWEEIKKILHTTTDGFGITDKDFYYWVDDNLPSVINGPCRLCIIEEGPIELTESTKTFYTYYNATIYSNENKMSLYINDMRELLSNGEGIIASISKMCQIAENNLNKLQYG